MEFEVDTVKSETNLRKHKIDFKETQNLWKDQYAAIVDARSNSESRSALIAFYRGKIWTAFSQEFLPRKFD